MHWIFSGNSRLAVLDIRKSALNHRRSQRFVQQPLVLIILCILCIHVPFVFVLIRVHSWFVFKNDRPLRVE